ncbi:MAG TPA: OsmC family protein [Thermoanaerobaculia bacterium]|jgi:organic hydroperoxide reductase OsmC/OhrA|nr:OsmC family protein [Thermoanaerobaculia bacterium]
MTSVLQPPRIKPKSFTYKTAVAEVEGRSASLRSEGKPSLRVASPPEFKGTAGVWTPEDFFVAAIEVCLMLTFVGVAEKNGLTFANYESKAEGLLEWDHQSYRFTRVVVRPAITLFDEHSIVAAHETLERAHATCLVAKSVSCEVVVEPVFSVKR